MEQRISLITLGVANVAVSRSFYERLGWERWLGPTGVRAEGGVELTPGETVMIQRTPGTPELDAHSLLTVEWRDGQPW